jgi:hypothetical protein
MSGSRHLVDWVHVKQPLSWQVLDSFTDCFTHTFAMLFVNDNNANLDAQCRFEQQQKGHEPYELPLFYCA